MSRITIKQIIQELTKSYILGYDVPAEPIELAKGYWELRIDDEIERDTKAGVTFADYEIWVKCAIADYETNLTLSKFAI
jgi:hypothetical protein